VKVFSIFDSKAEAFLQPLFASTTAVALRMFSSACKDESTEFHRFAGDYTLFELGEWFEDSGEFSMYEAKVNLGLASQFVEPAEPAQLRGVV